MTSTKQHFFHSSDSIDKVTPLMQEHFVSSHYNIGACLPMTLLAPISQPFIRPLAHGIDYASAFLGIMSGVCVAHIYAYS